MRKLPLQALERLQGARNILSKTPSVVGLDGFVDTIIHVVDTRESASEYSRLRHMTDFSHRIGAAAGLSANFEFVTQMAKLGGNGPIMANALSSFGIPITYIGSLGEPSIHPVFADFAKRVKVHSIAEPGYTDAIEFVDGKLMCGKLDSLRGVNWKCLTKFVPKEQLIDLFNASKFAGIVNWTMLPCMTEILRKLLSQVAPSLEGDKRWIFFDLADPAKRTREDIEEVLGVIQKFQKHFKVILGLNFNESRQIGSVLGLKSPSEEHSAVTDHAARLQEELKLDTVVIHPTHFAAAADATGSTFVIGPYTEQPKITTGAGDHFNAGFCMGRILKCDLSLSLQFGVATSGFYVRNARSPRLDDLKKFLQTL